MTVSTDHSFSTLGAYPLCKDAKGFMRFDGDADSPIRSSKSEKHDVFRTLNVVMFEGGVVEAAGEQELV